MSLCGVIFSKNSIIYEYLGSLGCINLPLSLMYLRVSWKKEIALYLLNRCLTQ